MYDFYHQTNFTLMDAPTLHTDVNELHFDNRFVQELPADPLANKLSREVTGACYSRVEPTPVAAPKLVAFARETAGMLDLSAAACTTEAFVQAFAGNRLLPGMQPYAMCYGGHQFGNWAGQLGDGRAINLGEVINRKNERYTLQLKGAGVTPYSRMADGVAVLRSSVREFLCSEAMHHLGVPTTHALSLVTTGERVLRDMFYDGNQRLEPGAIVCRVAPSFVRFGSFQILASRGENDILKQLADFTIRHDFAHLLESDGSVSKHSYIAWFKEVCERTADMIVHWMRVGFVHGVMNTDNMSILGLTIDYGPYGWLENYDPDWTPNTTDAHGRRYRFGQQPSVALWNLVQLANTIYPLIKDAAPLEAGLDHYKKHYYERWQQTIASKLGLSGFRKDEDEGLIADLEETLCLTETDMTIFYRALADIHNLTAEEKAHGHTLIDTLANSYYKPEDINDEIKTKTTDWLQKYLARCKTDVFESEQHITLMNKTNPKYVLRNYLSQQTIDKAEQGDFSEVRHLLDVLRKPYDKQPDEEQYAQKRPEWARHKPGCSMLSCSS